MDNDGGSMTIRRLARGACVAVFAAACGASPPIAPTPAVPQPAMRAVHAGSDDDGANDASDASDATVDPIALLARQDYAVGWIVPHQAELENRGAPIDAPADASAILVQVLEHHGHDLRVGVRLELARFALWTDTTGLLATVKRDVPVGEHAGGDFAFGADAPSAVLHAGAAVHVLGRSDAWVHVRYDGALEIEGWIPRDALADRGPLHDRPGYVPGGWHQLSVMPGATIRVEPKWSARALAVNAHGYVLDSVRDLGDDHFEVRYRDGDVDVHGFLGRREPPTPLHDRRGEVQAPPPAPPPTATVASGTCLYASPRGEAIGFIVGDAAVDLEPGTGSWFTITIDSPWGPLTFAARGASASDLVACAPAGSVPATKLKPATP